MRPFPINRAILGLLGGMSLLLLLPKSASAELTVGQYTLVQSTRITRTIYELTYNANMTNSGSAVLSATATLTGHGANITVVEGALDFGDVAGGATVTSRDTFKVRHDRTMPFDPASLVWQVQATNAVTDTMLPTITASVDPPPNQAGWNNTDVTVTFICADMGSGIAACPSPVTMTTEGKDQTITVSATDQAGNTAITTVLISVDKTPPVLTITSPADGAQVIASPVAVSATVTDVLSGTASVTCQGTPALVSIGTVTCGAALTTGPNPIAVQAADIAGNTTTSNITVALLQGNQVPLVGEVPPNLQEALNTILSQEVEDPTIIRRRYVVLASDQIGGVNLPQGSPQLRLALFPDVDLIALRDDVETRSADDYSWFGHIDDNESSLVVLTVGPDGVVGYIFHYPNTYAIRIEGGGIQGIYEIDQSAYPPDEGQVSP